MADLRVENHGSLYLLFPETEAGERWTEENLQEGAPMFGGATVIGHRYILDIVQGAINDGLTVE